MEFPWVGVLEFLGWGAGVSGMQCWNSLGCSAGILWDGVLEFWDGVLEFWQGVLEFWDGVLEFWDGVLQF